MLKAHLGRKSGESLRIFGQKWISTAVGSVHFSHANPPIFKIFNKGSFLRHFWKSAQGDKFRQTVFRDKWDYRSRDQNFVAKFKRHFILQRHLSQFCWKISINCFDAKKFNSHIQSNHPGFGNFGVFKATLFSKSGIRGVNLKIGQIWMKWKIVIKSGPNQTAPKCSTNWQDFFCLCFFFTTVELPIFPLSTFAVRKSEMVSKHFLF